MVTVSAEKKYRYKVDRRTWRTVTLWETTIQSPYSAEFTEEQARTQIREELFSRNGNWVIGRIGINGRYAGDYEDLISDEKVEPEFLERNIALGGQQGLKMNFKTGYWELSIFHTKPLSRVPEDMRARTVADRRAR